MIKFIEKKLLNKLEARVSAWWYGLSEEERDMALDAYHFKRCEEDYENQIKNLSERLSKTEQTLHDKINDLRAENIRLKKQLDPNYQPVKKIGND